MEPKNEAGNVPVPVNVAGGMLAIIERIAVDPNADVEKLERMLALQERIIAKQAEMEFNEALARIAEKMPRIVKGKTVGYDIDKNDKSKGQKEAFRYAAYEDIDKIIRPMLVEEGFSLSYTTAMKPEGGCIVTGRLSHRNGHYRESSIPMPLDANAKRNNAQNMASTFTYGKRYTMCMLLNIVTVGEDDDGSGGPITDEQAKEIKVGLRESGLETTKLLKALKAESVEEIRLKDYRRAITAIDARKWQNLQNEKKNANPA